MMKKILNCLLLQLTFICPVSFGAEVCEKITITGPPASPPASWTVDGKLVGASVDFLQQIAYRAGVKTVEIKTYDSWPKTVEAARKGDVDMIFHLVWSSKRNQFFEFIRPAYSEQFLEIIVLKGKSFKLNKYDDLIGRKGAAGKGESYGDTRFEQLVDNKLDLIRTNRVSDSFELLLSGKVDYVMAYENSVFSEILKNGLSDKVEHVRTYPFQTDVYAAFSRRSPCAEKLVPKFSELVKLETKLKIYYKLTDKYKNIFNLQLNNDSLSKEMTLGTADLNSSEDSDPLSN